MRQIPDIPHNSVTLCNWHTWAYALPSIKQLSCRNLPEHQLNQFNPDALIHFWPQWDFQWILAWTHRALPLTFGQLFRSKRSFSGVTKHGVSGVILKGSVPKGCVCTVQWVMVHDPLLQHQPSLFQNWKRYTRFTIANSAALLLAQRLTSFHGTLQSWGDLLLCCELWGLAGLSTDIGTVRAHYFSYAMTFGSVKPLWWSSFLPQTSLGKTAKHRGVEKSVTLSTMIWAQHHHLLRHPCFLQYFLSQVSTTTFSHRSSSWEDTASYHTPGIPTLGVPLGTRRYQ